VSWSRCRHDEQARAIHSFDAKLCCFMRGRLAAEERILVWLDDLHEVARMRVVELVARALVEHVGIESTRSQERHALLGLGAFLLQLHQFGGQRDDLLVELLTCVEAVFTGLGIDPEIADHHRRQCIEHEPGEDRFEAGMLDHSRKCDGPVKANLTTGPQPEFARLISSACRPRRRRRRYRPAAPAGSIP
jgi:hypothetical protein